MVYSSVIFLFYFFPFTISVYHLLEKKYRNYFLLIASLFFYAWGEPVFVFVMAGIIAVNYCAGLLIECTKRILLKKIMVFISVVINIGILVYYKYFSFLLKSINEIGEVFNVHSKMPVPEIILPIGLSFFIFQGLSYVIDVYREDTAAQKNPFKVALYISLFPQLIAGPIVRYTDISKEIDNRNVKIEDTYYGFARFIIGLAKKVAIADVLAGKADQIFNLGGHQITPLIAWIGAIFYTLQIYFDFSAYSDMAIGLGRLFGFHFRENFDLPYISTSITEFWRRWHISLSLWFRDYLYIPMGGNRRGNVYLHLIIVFLCTGIWHGANWTFVAWGMWHGVYILIERLLKKKNSCIHIPRVVQWIYTMLVVILGWVLFRSDTIKDGIMYMITMFGKQPHTFQWYNVWYFLDAQIIFTLVLAILLSLGVQNKLSAVMYSNRPLLLGVKSIVLCGILIYSLSMVVNGNYSPFIYFRF